MNREAGMLVLYNRIKDSKESLGISTFRRTPSIPVELDDLLCIYMVAGVDRIIKPVSRNPLGYPARREVEIVMELINLDSFDFITFYTSFRSAVLTSSKLTDDCFVRETRTVGPVSYNHIANVVGMQMILAMSYTDEG